MKRQQWLVFVPVTLATAGLAACASVLGGEDVKIRPVDTMQTLTGAPRDPLYESAVSAINERDYGRALEYLQAAKAKDPRNVKALNALGVVYDKLGRFDLSARYYAQARVIEPDSRIVAENLGYSRVLQHLLNPNQPIAVANIDLPPGLINPAPPVGAPAPAAPVQPSVVADLVPVLPVAEKKVIDASPPTVTSVPLGLPDAKHVFADIALPEPAVPVVERKLIDTPPPTVMAMPVELPDAKRLFAEAALPVPVTEKKLIDTPRPTVAAVPLGLPDAKHAFADIALPEPVVPVVERKLIDTPPPTMTAMPLQLPDAKRLFAEVAIPVPVAEKKLIDTAPPAVTAAPFVLPDTKPLFAASLSAAVFSLPVPGTEKLAPAEPVASTATMTVIAARPVAAAPISAIPVALMEPVPSVAPAAVAATAAVPAASVAKAVPVSMVPTAQPSAKPAAVAASVRSVAASPAKSAIKKPVTVASVSARPAVPVLPAKQVMPVSPVRPAAAIPVKGKVLTIGQPIKLVNASGKSDGAGTVLRRLTSLGWTMRPADSRIQPATVLFYPVQNLAAAKAMQRTLPFPVRLVAEPSKASGMRLVIGRDYLSWKPRNSRIAALWQKRLVIASAQKLSLRGVR